jgi:hypothetical protein
MKAQVSIEYIIFIGIMLVLFTLASYAALSAGRDIAEDNEVSGARQIAALVSQELGISVEVGDGYSHAFILPGSLNGFNYSVNLTESRFVSVSWKNKSYILPTLAENVQGSISIGNNTIENNGGVITIA